MLLDIAGFVNTLPRHASELIIKKELHHHNIITFVCKKKRSVVFSALQFVIANKKYFLHMLSVKITAASLQLEILLKYVLSSVLHLYKQNNNSMHNIGLPIPQTCTNQ